MILLILGVTVIIYTISLGYISLNLRQEGIAEGKKLTNTYALRKANEIKTRMNDVMSAIRSSASIMRDYLQYPTELREKLQRENLFRVLDMYPFFESTWMSWELEAIDPDWELPYGRERIICFYQDGKEKVVKENMDT